MHALNTRTTHGRRLIYLATRTGTLLISRKGGHRRRRRRPHVGPRARRILWCLPVVVIRPSYLLVISLSNLDTSPPPPSVTSVAENSTTATYPFHSQRRRPPAVVHERSSSATTRHANPSRKSRRIADVDRRASYHRVVTVVTYHDRHRVAPPSSNSFASASLLLSLSLSSSLSLPLSYPFLRRAPFDLSFRTNHEPLRELSVTIHLSVKCVKGPPTPSAGPSPWKVIIVSTRTATG